jgi:hypothetical protein
MTAQIGQHDGKAFRELRCNLVPLYMGRRMAVKQKQRRPLPTDERIDRGPAGLDELLLETGEEASVRCLRSVGQRP